MVRLYWQIPVLSRAVFGVWKLDARRKLDWIAPWIKKEDRLLEIGSGPGSVVALLRQAGHDVTGLDIANSSFDDTLAPVVYDGSTMPFDDRHFDVALLLTTLHHTADPDKILREARRVGRRVIVIEDIYDTPLQRRLTKIADSITNMEFFGHPHSNRSDAGWRKTFKSMGLSVLHASHKPMVRLFKQALYVLERNDAPDPDQAR